MKNILLILVVVSLIFWNCEKEKIVVKNDVDTIFIKDTVYQNSQKTSFSIINTTPYLLDVTVCAYKPKIPNCIQIGVLGSGETSITYQITDTLVTIQYFILNKISHIETPFVLHKGCHTIISIYDDATVK